eukprot:gene32678-17693_t
MRISIFAAIAQRIEADSVFLPNRIWSQVVRSADRPSTFVARSSEDCAGGGISSASPALGRSSPPPPRGQLGADSVFVPDRIWSQVARSPGRPGPSSPGHLKTVQAAESRAPARH